MLVEVTEEERRAGEQRAYAAHLVTVQEDERRRLVQDLHDDPVQTLIYLVRMREHLSDDPRLPPDLAPLVLRDGELATEVVDVLRTVIHGFRSLSRQIRATEANEIPSSLANSRADQFVTPRCSGGAAKVATTTSKSSITDGRPERCRSSKPAIPASEYRFRHRITVGRDAPTATAIAVFDTPSEASSTIRALWAKPASTVEDRTNELSLGSSPERNTIAVATDIPHYPKTTP